MSEPTPKQDPMPPEEPIPLDGWPLSMAVRRLLPEFHMKVLGAALAVEEGNQDERGIRHYRGILWPLLIQQIVKLDVMVTGFAPGALAQNRTVIAPTWVQDATPNFDENSLTLGDVIYTGVRFAPTSGEAAKDAFAVKVCKPHQAEINQWMAAYCQKNTKRDAAVSDCRKTTGATYRQALAAWGELPLSIRGTRGTKKT